MFSFFRRPATPKIIHLRGEPLKKGQDIEEKPEHLGALLDSMAPAPIRVRLPAHISPAALEILVWLWEERGFRTPSLNLEPAELFSLTILDQGETFPRLGHAHLSATEQAQLALQAALLAHLPRFLHRDYVLQEAQAAGLQLDPRQLNRLSKYLRALLQAGDNLPPVHAWPELSHTAPFDQIGSGLQSPQTRTPLQPEQRTDLIFQALTEETRNPKVVQAIEEFWAALNLPPAPLNPMALIRSALQDPVEQLQGWAQRTSDFEAQILQAQTLPAVTFGRLQRTAILARTLSPQQRSELETHLGPLPRLLATPAQEEWARRCHPAC